MARGDMKYVQTEVSTGVEILNRPPFEAVPMTLDFTSVSAVGGVKVVKAGTPINASGVAVKANPWTGAVGILLHDVYEERPQGTILKKAYINSAVVAEHAGITYDATIKGMFPMIVFE